MAFAINCFGLVSLQQVLKKLRSYLILFISWCHRQLGHLTLCLQHSCCQLEKSLSCPHLTCAHLLYIHQLNTPSPPFVFMYLHYKQGRLLRSNVRHRVKKPSRMIWVLLVVLTYNHFTSHIKIFLPAPSATFFPFQLSKHAGLSFSHMITYHLSGFLQADTLHTVHVTRFSAKWSGLLGRECLAKLVTLNQPLLFPVPPPPLITCQQEALHLYYAWWEEYNQTHNALAQIPPLSLNKLTPIPFLLTTLHTNMSSSNAPYIPPHINAIWQPSHTQLHLWHWGWQTCLCKFCQWDWSLSLPPPSLAWPTLVEVSP